MLLISFKLLLRRVGYIVALLLLPIIACIAALMSKPLQPTVDYVGFYVEDNNADRAIVNDIEYILKSSEINIRDYPNLEAMKLDIMRGNISAGYVFEKGFGEKLIKRSFTEIVDVYYLGGNTAATFANELFVSAIIKTATPYITQQFLQEKFGTVDFEKVKSKVYEYFNSENIMKITVENANLNTNKNLQNGREHQAGILAKALSATMLLSLCIMSAAHISGQLANDSIKFLSTRYGKINVLLNLMLPNAILSFIFGSGAIILSNFLLGDLLNIPTVFINVFLYTLLLSGISLVLAVLGNDTIISAIMPFIVIAAFIFSPTFIDIASFLPPLAVIRDISPVTIFLRGF